MTPNVISSKPNPQFVEIVVGPNSEKFKIHLDAIIHYSPFFKEAFTNQQYGEAETKVMKFENVDEKVFGLFNNWLYTQDILHADDTEPRLMELAKLWTAAGKWKIPSLQNQAMGDLSRMLIDEPEPPTQCNDAILQEFLAHAYAAREVTALKRLAVQKMIRVLPSVVSLKEWVAQFPEGMMADIAEALMKHHQSLPAGHKTPVFQIQQYMVRQNGGQA